MGIPATNKDFSFEAIDIMRFADGMCIEHWGISDQVGLMTQLGLMPGP
jgi:predicted ester cyclase